ncbi:uncharacterized protein NPIL_432611 [Nephila pilipes]|uniref:Uncharacterized protein n=1 Tax=Nephila pilipes TaxID=299642 RepID=A0A8X6TGZ1_NEPPI|nr:uncharacterized protein NPIL_432611 [Nephila pilipes]
MAETKWISSSSEVKSVRRIFLSTVRDLITVWLQENGKHFPNEFLMISGGLKVYVRPESQVFGELPATWVTFGDQGNQWYRGNVSIPQFSESFQIIIEGIRGSSYIGDTAIDDVSINTVDCENVGNLTDNTFGITSDSCRGRCRESDNSSVCGCNDDCVESGICCEDFMSICTKSDGDDNKDEQPFGRTTIVTTILDISDTDAELTTIETSAKDESSDSVSSSVAPVSQATFVSSSISTRTSEKESEKHDDFAVTATEIITSLENDFPNTSTRITEATSPISLSNISTTVPGTSSIPSALSSSSTSSTTTITSTTKSTTTPTVTSTTKSTTTPTVTSTTKSTTTPSTTSTQSTTTKSIMFSSFSTLLSSASIDEKLTSTSSSVSTNPSTTVATTISEFQTELPETQSTRKTYNLRPRTRTTTMMTSSTKEISTLNTPLLLSTLAYESTSLRSSSAGVSSTTETPIPTRVTNSHYIRPTKMTSIVPTVWIHPQISMISSPIRIVTTTTKSASILRKTTKKFTPFDPRIKPTEMSKFDTEAHAAKTSSSDDRQPVITIISVIIVIIICAAAGLVFFIKRWKVKKLSKIEDDSEMRFLSENEVVEYSDSSALDRINFNP